MSNPAGRPPVPHGQLTEHQTRVVAEIAQGGTYEQVGKRLGIARTAVRAAMGRAADRLDATTPAHVVARAIALRIIPAGTALTPADRPTTPQETRP